MKPLLCSFVSRDIKRLLVILSLLPACAASAAQSRMDSLVACGRVYRNVIILGYNATDAYLSHQGGINNVKLRYLDPKTQALFHYDERAAAEAEERQAAEDALYNELLASNMVAEARAARAAKKGAASSEDNLADPVSPKSLIGKQAPAIKGEKWLGEKPELEGKMVLVAFWEPWSIPCRNCIAKLGELQKKFTDKLAVVGVTSESESEIADMAEPKPDFPSLLDPEAKLITSVGVTSVPYVMLVDAKGIVRYQGHPTAVTEKQVQHLLAKAAEENPSSAAAGVASAR